MEHWWLITYVYERAKITHHNWPQHSLKLSIILIILFAYRLTASGI